MGIDYTPEMLDFFISSDKVRAYTLLRAIYVNESEKDPANQRLLRQITPLNARTKTGFGNPEEEEGQVFRENEKTLQRILSQAETNAQIGLTVLIKIAPTISTSNQQPYSSSN